MPLAHDRSLASCALALALVITAASASCSQSNTAFNASDGTGGTGSGFGDKGSGFGANGKGQSDANITSLTIDPAMAAIDIVNGMGPSQPFKATAHYADGTSAPLAAVAWSVDQRAVGTISGAGVFAPQGSRGGVVSVTASVGGKKASAQLTVKLHIKHDDAAIAEPTRAALRTATAKDTATAWAYPYDGTAFPGGLEAPLLMWNGGAATDTIYTHITSDTFDYERFSLASGASFAAPPPAAQMPFDATDWAAFTSSTAGAAHVQITRFDGAAATVVANLTWKIAAAEARGSIYYWANSLGRVERLRPGAKGEDFTAGIIDATRTSCTMTCHSVAANGSVLISGGGAFGGSFDLLANKPMANLGGVWGAVGPDGKVESDWQNAMWDSAAISPDGKYVAINANARDRTAALGGPATMPGLYLTSEASPVAQSGIDDLRLYVPAFAPGGGFLAYADLGNPAGVGPLRLIDFDPTKTPLFSNARDLVAPGTDPAYSHIAWPSVSPDNRWVIYQRGTSYDSRGLCPNAVCDFGNRGELYLADVQTGTETRLDALNGDGYPFAAGADRDGRWNFEPSFAPVAAGGYFWVVFTSRRTYGNVLTAPVFKDNADATGAVVSRSSLVKQLWVAAIDANPTPGKDPSHAAFLLPGQDLTALNMRGFWALDPCKQDGQGCGSGTECCGGYCDTQSPIPLCASSQSASCAADGDHCNADADCCAGSGATQCINHFCSTGAR